jgi:pimeloyl-ACP methyl ester carboxylesterase
MEWAAVVEEVLDVLRIDQCSVMAHSAGAPYALSFANKAPERVRGNICLLAPWVGGSESGGETFIITVFEGCMIYWGQ